MTTSPDPVEIIARAIVAADGIDPDQTVDFGERRDRPIWMSHTYLAEEAITALTAGGHVIAPKVEDGELREKLNEAAGWALCRSADGAGPGKCDPKNCVCHDEGKTAIDGAWPLIAAREASYKTVLDSYALENGQLHARAEATESQLATKEQQLVEAGERIKVLEATLKRVEWCLDGDCPLCWAGVEKHRPGCELAAALKNGGAEQCP